MAIVLAISGRQPLEVDAESISLGSDPAGTVALPGDYRIKPRHAVIRRVAGRWLVEACDNETIQVGDSQPGRVHWLKPGDVIYLVENGPAITFQPAPGSQPASPPFRQEHVTSAAPPPVAPLAPVPYKASVPLSAQAPLDADIPLAAQAPLAPRDSGPAGKTDLSPLFDPLFEPAANRAADPPSSRRSRGSPDQETGPATPSRKSETRKRREDSFDPPSGNRPRPNQVESDEPDEPGSGPGPVVEELDPDGEEYEVSGRKKRQPKLPVLGRGAGFSGSEKTSETAFGWTAIWVLVGLGVLAVGTIVWFATSPDIKDDYKPPVAPGTGPRVIPNRASR